MPGFSIVIPVLNGGDYIKECIGRIFSQTIQDFNIHILDSGSTDGTLQWLTSLNDPRIIIFPSNYPLTVEQNWARIKTIPRNEWMTIIGHDDKFYPNYLEAISGLIREHDDASLFGTHFDFIDGSGNLIKKINPIPQKMLPAEFLGKLIKTEIGVVSMTMRSADYDRIGGLPQNPGLLFTDFPLHIELARLSYVVISPSYCVSYRLHTTNATFSTKYESYYEAFDRYIQYLNSLKITEQQYSAVINKTAKELLQLRCIEFTSKLLRTPKSMRKIFKTIPELSQKFKQYADLLIDNNVYDPAKEKSVRIAKLIDRTWLTRKLFTLIKKIHKGPILKKESTGY